MDLNEDDVIQIIRYLDESNFNELQLRLGDLRIVVNRTGSSAPLPELEQPNAPVTEAAAPPLASPPPQPQPEPPAPTGQPQSPEETAAVGQRSAITSPMLGTFYRAPAPGEAPFVEVGSVVEEDTTVCIIEVMKLFTTIKAEKRGRVVRISAEDGQLVEYGQVLFTLAPLES